MPLSPRKRQFIPLPFAHLLQPPVPLAGTYDSQGKTGHDVCYECLGVIHSLIRMHGFMQNDTHIFYLPDHPN